MLKRLYSRTAVLNLNDLGLEKSTILSGVALILTVIVAMTAYTFMAESNGKLLLLVVLSVAFIRLYIAVVLGMPLAGNESTVSD